MHGAANCVTSAVNCHITHNVCQHDGGIAMTTFSFEINGL